MPNQATRTGTRLFVALPIPEKIKTHLLEATSAYPQYIRRLIPPDNWHVTLVFLGEVAKPGAYLPGLTQPLPQAFVPTISMTHVGRGLKRDQLWAYVTPTLLLETIHQTLMARLKDLNFPLPPDSKRAFVPHIHLANFYPLARGVGLADTPLPITFRAQRAEIFRSEFSEQGVHYKGEGSIAF